MMRALFCIFLVAASSETTAGEWPQIFGPTRNSTANQEKLAKKWPQGGPPTLWKREIGRGFAGPAVAQGRVVVFHRLGDLEIVEALDAKTGNRLWKTTFPARFRGQIFPDQDGPICVPLVHDRRVYLFGAGGDLHCVRLADGKKQWSRALYKEFKSRGGLIDYGYFGVGATPIVAGGKLLVNVGGRKGAGIVALSLADGKTIWKSTSEGASYSSPVAATIDEQWHVIFVTRMNVVSVDPKDGAVRFRFPFGKRGPTVNGATPLVVGDRLFVSASYGVGALMARVDRDGAKTVWTRDDVMSSQYSTCVHKDGYLYGTHGRADQGVADLRCVELKTGKIAWSKDAFGIASPILAGDKLLIQKDDGKLVLAQVSPERFRQLASAQVLTSTTRALPALSGGRLYVRDTKTLKCLDVGLRP